MVILTDLKLMADYQRDEKYFMRLFCCFPSCLTVLRQQIPKYKEQLRKNR